MARLSSSKIARAILAWILSLTLIVGFIPTAAFADPAPSADDPALAEGVQDDAAVDGEESSGVEDEADDAAEPQPAEEVAELEEEAAAPEEEPTVVVDEPAAEIQEETVQADEKSYANAPLEEENAAPTLTYRAHQQRYGWMDWVSAGKAAGQTGQTLRVEAFQAKVQSTLSGSIQYRALVQGQGWMDWVSDGKAAGTTGQSLRMEAIQVKLTGELAEKYDVWYRVHIQKHGWIGWTKNGAKAGSANCKFRLESIQIRLVAKDGKAPGDTANPYRTFNPTYTTHVQKQGWQKYVAQPKTSGTTGKELRTEAFKVDLDNNAWNGSIKYRAHVQSKGWMNWVDEDEVAGTTGQGLRMEAIQIKLTGEMATNYDIYYRAHVQGFGWMGWAKNGESAGSQNYGKRLEALQIKVVFKGAAAPGSTSGAFKRYVPPPPEPEIPAEYKPYINKANNYSSNTNWLILVDRDNYRTVVLYGKKGSWEVEKFWLCTVGASSSPTVTGVFTIQSRGISFGSGYTCWYWTQFYGNYLFHSVKYVQGSKTRFVDGRLGVSASHGCVRLAIDNARWIYNNIPRGTKVVIYN